MSFFVLVANAFAYLLTFVLYIKKIGSFNLGSFVLLFYSLLAFLAVYLFSFVDFWTFNDIQIFPFIYLYGCLMISCRALLKFSGDKVKNMVLPDEKIMNCISICIIVSHIGLLLFSILSSFSISGLFDPNQLALNYDDKLDSVGVDDKAVNIFGVLKNVFGDLLWIMIMYNWIKGNKLLIIGLLFSVVVVILDGLSGGARGSLVRIVLSVPFVYFAFAPIMNKRMKRTFITSIIVVFSLILIGFLALTFGRFSDSSFSILDICVYYASSNFIYFNNYALDAGGIRYGDRTFPLLRSLLGFDTAGDFFERRSMYDLELDDSQFSFFVGDFVLDFGPFYAFLLIVVFSWCFCRSASVKKYDLGDILLFSFLFRICVNGFTLFPYAEFAGNLRILYILFFVFVFKYFTEKRITIL